MGPKTRNHSRTVADRENVGLLPSKQVENDEKPRKRHALRDLSNVHKRPQGAKDRVSAEGSKQSRVPKEVVQESIPMSRSESISTARSTPASESFLPEEDLRDVIIADSVTTPTKEYIAKVMAKTLCTTSLHSTELYEYGKDDSISETLDAQDAQDPMMVAEYVDEIFDYLYELEKTTLTDPQCLTFQTEVNQDMRNILVDWLVEVHTSFRLMPETLYLALNIFDRFLTLKQVKIDRLQLIGATCLFIAAKYEEIFPPVAEAFVFVGDGVFRPEDLHEAEILILNCLDYSMSYPNPMNFLRRISKADSSHMETRTIAKYLLELTAVSDKFHGIEPSLCAATAMFLSKCMLSRWGWDDKFIAASGGYSLIDLERPVRLLLELLLGPRIYESSFKKYCNKRYFKAALLVHAMFESEKNMIYETFFPEYHNTQ
ncbi:hypothetical protein CANCADRAFT_30077 [Tortispora caseinolytica NRRL Y-17796]|uniref:Uncharacterized protein n=1 Tax=Tortispora caseinolytica NRRL Y-17796 TaxID=767744 RepID=A0A1E4TJ09_9ASCO|nr:hypothetical protein CANCADRAFT_30077 [Tortispora caseinolytica NRRL Y-17796]